MKIKFSGLSSRSQSVIILLSAIFLVSLFIAFNFWFFSRLVKRNSLVQGPGTYACDNYGICNIYQDPEGANCPKTYADLHCLNECGDLKVRCPK